MNTVDKYQGFKNDYVLLLFVRTKHFGHLLDARRIVVAMSRARLGVCVLGRLFTLKSCMQRSFCSQSVQRPRSTRKFGLFIDGPIEMGILVSQLASRHSIL